MKMPKWKVKYLFETGMISEENLQKRALRIWQDQNLQVAKKNMALTKVAGICAANEVVAAFLF